MTVLSGPKANPKHDSIYTTLTLSSSLSLSLTIYLTRSRLVWTANYSWWWSVVVRSGRWWLQPNRIDRYSRLSQKHVVKCHDFAKMPCFLLRFCKNAVVLRFHKNILFLISITWSLLCEFNKKIFTFSLPLLPKSVSFVTYWRNMWPWCHSSMYFT